jgi:hypothetical protein
MNPERSFENGVVAGDLIRDYMGWWAYLTVMGGLAPTLGGFTAGAGPAALNSGFDGEQPLGLMPSEFMRAAFPDLALPRDSVVG